MLRAECVCGFCVVCVWNGVGRVLVNEQMTLSQMGDSGVAQCGHSVEGPCLPFPRFLLFPHSTRCPLWWTQQGGGRERNGLPGWLLVRWWGSDGDTCLVLAQLGSFWKLSCARAQWEPGGMWWCLRLCVHGQALLADSRFTDYLDT